MDNYNLTPEKREIIEKFRRWMIQRRYAENTIRTYTGMLKIFLGYYHEKKTGEIGLKDVNRFNYYFIIQKGLSASYQNQMISAIKLFYLKMLGTNLDLSNLERPQKTRPLPKVIPKEIVKEMLQRVGNQKHKTALIMVYSLGLRRGELLNIKLTDLSSRDKTLVVRNAKGGKDRLLPIPEKLMNLIIAYYRAYEPEYWLFEGEKKGKRYSATSLGKIFHRNLSKVLKKHNFTPLDKKKLRCFSMFTFC